MEPVVLALASNERYFPGLYCAVASALSHLDAAREVDLKVLDGGISQTSRDTLSRLIDRSWRPVRLEFVTVDPSVFGKRDTRTGQIAHGLLPDIAATLAGCATFDLPRLRRVGIPRSLRAF